MECTIITFKDGRKELYYGEQAHSGMDGMVYDLGEAQIEQIRTCATSQVQSVLAHLENNFTPIKVLKHNAN